MKKIYKNQCRTTLEQRPGLMRLFFSLFVMILFFGCAKDNTSSLVIIVHNGHSIQAAVNQARPGTTIYIEPGIYKEAVEIKKAGIHIIGLDGPKGAGVIIRNPGGKDNGISVTSSGDHFSLENLTVEGFDENGVFLNGVDGFKISYIQTYNNGEYGIFPVFSIHGVIDHCTASGHSDTGIYVGQSSEVVMQFNTAFANVNGLEIENSSKISATENHSYNNVVGILVTLLPGLDVKTSSGILISQNLVNDNNHRNFAPPGDLAAVVPSGLGILILGTDLTQVEKNAVQGNNFAGIVVFSTLVLGQLAGLPPAAFAGIEPNPDGVSVQKNILLKNGSAPPPLPIPLPGVDLLWDGSGKNNCWSSNIFISSYPSPLPVCK